MHRARYRRFMASPAYAWAHDIVAVDDAGEVGAFAIWWPDPVLGLAQFEPVGTHPAHQRRGLARAVLAHCLAQMPAVGIEVARVYTDAHLVAATHLYPALGFVETARLHDWERTSTLT